MTRTTRIAAALFALAVGFLPAAALAVTLARAAGAPAWVELPFGLVCHGLDSRSFAIDGFTMPICARCTAIYVGAIAGIAMFFVLPALRRSPLAGWVLLVALLPMILDGGTQAIRIRESTNLLRLLTGAPAGALFLIFVLGRVEKQTAGEDAPPRVTPAAAS